MSFGEDELLPLSGLQHLIFCERQAALIHVEQVWADNALTVEGSYRHRRVHETGPRRERRGNLIISRGVMLRSLELGLSGVADVVEFHLLPESHPAQSGALRLGVSLPRMTGRWVPFPVEYKRGRPKSHRADEVQLCAQALCLEEMLGTSVGEGALFYGKEQRRVPVSLDAELRALTREAASRFHELISEGEMPAPAIAEKCRSCSLAVLCAPEAMSRRQSVSSFVAAEVRRMLRDDGSLS